MMIQMTIIMRTNANDVSEEILSQELESLVLDYEELIKTAHTRTCFSCLKKAPKEYLTELKNFFIYLRYKL